jgi:hypothetical protein
MSISIAARISTSPIYASKISPDEDLEGGSEGAILGKFFDHHRKDFKPSDTPNFQYMPYLLEARLQAGFLISMTLANSERNL